MQRVTLRNLDDTSGKEEGRRLIMYQRIVLHSIDKSGKVEVTNFHGRNDNRPLGIKYPLRNAELFNLVERE